MIKRKRSAPAEGEKKATDHAEIAKRFMDFVSTMDLIIGSYKRTVPLKTSSSNYPLVKKGEAYLVTHLKHVLESRSPKKLNTRLKGGTHKCIKKLGLSTRVTVPSTIRSAINSLTNPPWSSEKIEATWISCYINKIHPDQKEDGWREYECSHRCISHNRDGPLDPDVQCISKKCLVWESKSANQSRGYQICWRECSHCNGVLCRCQNIHNPPCH